jgi:uncharacterized membrane protein YdcZ (DUF606 family)
MALAAGINIVISTSINAMLGKKIGMINNAMVYYFIYACTCIGAFLLFARTEPFVTGTMEPLPWYAYTGSVIAVLTLLLSTYAMQRFSAVYYVLITYLAQMFTAVAYDFFVHGDLNIYKAGGSAIMLCGLLLDMKLTKMAPHKKTLEKTPKM